MGLQNIGWEQGMAIGMVEKSLWQWIPSTTSSKKIMQGQHQRRKKHSLAPSPSQLQVAGICKWLLQQCPQSAKVHVSLKNVHHYWIVAKEVHNIGSEQDREGTNDHFWFQWSPSIEQVNINIFRLHPCFPKFYIFPNFKIIIQISIIILNYNL